jgi:phospholipase A1
VVTAQLVGADQLAVDVLVTNGSAESLPFLPAQTLPVRIEVSGHSPVTRQLSLEVVAPPARDHQAGSVPGREIAAGAFARAEYRTRLPLVLPAGAAVTVTVQRPGYNLAAFVVPAHPGWPGSQVARANDSAVREDQTAPPAVPLAAPASDHLLFGHVYSYQPSYALLGLSPTEGKLQLSLRYQPFASGASGPAWLEGINLAYTQTMFADMSADSTPLSTIYQPEVFYLLHLTSGADELASVKAGIRHESNGRDGPESRTANFLYVQPSAGWTVAGDLDLTVSPSAWVYVGSLSDNPDLKRYRGYTALEASLGRPYGWQLSGMVRGNPGTGKGAVQADVSYPLSPLLDLGLDFYLHAQLFSGYGEDLLRYDRRSTRLRFGLSLVR